jgi:hypothetical protein
MKRAAFKNKRLPIIITKFSILELVVRIILSVFTASILFSMTACQSKSMAVELKKKILPELENNKCAYLRVLTDNKIEYRTNTQAENQEDNSKANVIFFIIDEDGYLGRTGFRFILYIDEKGCIIKQKVTNYNY